MSDSGADEVDPQVALARFLTAIKNYADVDTNFRDSLIQALGVTVKYQGEDDLLNIEPHIVAARKDELQFRAIYGQVTAAKLKSILTTKTKLATPADVKSKSAEDMMDMLWKRARSRARERGLID